MDVGVVFRDLKISVRRVSRSSGTMATPMFGSTVENGKLATTAFPPTSALKIVDFPTLGSPIIPQFNAIAPPQPWRLPRQPPLPIVAFSQDSFIQ